MRTPEQLVNCRNVLIRIFGPIVLFMPDEFVDRYMDTLQSKLNSEFGSVLEKKLWSTKVRIKDVNDTIDWNEINPEPNQLHASFDDIKSLCFKTFEKHKTIVEFQVTNVKDADDVFIFKRIEVKNV